MAKKECFIAYLILEEPLEYLREMCPNTELFLVPIWTLFTQCSGLKISLFEYDLKIWVLFVLRIISTCFRVPRLILPNHKEKIDHWISWKLIIICLKSISKECFLYNRKINTSLKFLWALGEHSGGSWALDHSEGTRLFGHLKLSGNRALRVIRQMSTWAFREFRHLSTQTLGHLGVLGPWGTLFSRLDSKWGVHFPLNI